MIQFRRRINILNGLKRFYHYVATCVLLDDILDNNLVPQVGDDMLHHVTLDKVALERHSE